MLKRVILAMALTLSTPVWAINCDKVGRVAAFAAIHVASTSVDAGTMLGNMSKISTAMKLSQEEHIVALGLYSQLLTEDIKSWYDSLTSSKGDENKVRAAYISVYNVCTSLFNKKYY